MFSAPKKILNMKELDAIYKRNDKDFDHLIKVFKMLDDNICIMTSNEDKIEELEKLLKLQSTGSLHERRQRILIKYNSQPPYTMRTLRKKFDSIYGEGKYTIDIDYVTRELYFSLAESVWGGLIDMYKMLNDMVPLDLILEPYLELNTSHSISNDCSIDISIDFYPRYNLAPLLLDGTWMIDGSYFLTGYKSDERFDFNPLSLHIAIDHLVKQRHEASFYVSIDTEIQSQQEASTKIDMEVNHNVNHDSGTHAYIDTYVSCSSDAEVTIKENYWMLDGSVILDGSRFLNADEINLTL